MFNVPCQTKDRRGLVYAIMFYLLLAEIFGHLLKLGLGDEPVVVLVHHLQRKSNNIHQSAVPSKYSHP
jgi:hypothetical protein